MQKSVVSKINLFQTTFSNGSKTSMAQYRKTSSFKATLLVHADIRKEKFSQFGETKIGLCVKKSDLHPCVV